MVTITDPYQWFTDSPRALRPLWYWMTVRHNIYVRRKLGAPKPWTSDPILQQYRFCNVFRELDTVTIWVRENIRERFATSKYLWFMLAIARYINHPPTLKELIDEGAWPLGEDFEPSHMTEVLDARKARGEQVYTGAYMIRAESNPKAEWYSWTKQRYIAEIVLGRLWESREATRDWLSKVDTLEAAWQWLAKNRHFVGWGPFMTYEWVTDLRHTGYLCNAGDIRTWANPGPGALRGLVRLQNGNGALEGKLPNHWSANEQMRSLMERAPEYLLGFPPLEMRDIEHSLCEVDKYLRVFRGEGKPRAKYNGTA
jgi:hypothetical protein